MLRPGDAVPAFSLPASDGKTYTAKGLRGKRYILYFYPKDQTPGCTREGCDFTTFLPAFRKLGVAVLGVSGGTVESKKKFAKASKIGIPLLADEDLSAAKAFGAWGKKKNYGRTYMGLIRSTFLVSPEGEIEAVWKSVKVEGHAGKVLAKAG